MLIKNLLYNILIIQWNYNVSTQYFLDQRVSSYFVPVINGFIETYNDVNIDNSLYNITLISRRSQYHAGVRYHTRGLNDNNNPANFVETEQIIVKPDGTINSFVMV